MHFFIMPTISSWLPGVTNTILMALCMLQSTNENVLTVHLNLLFIFHHDFKLAFTTTSSAQTLYIILYSLCVMLVNFRVYNISQVVGFEFATLPQINKLFI